MRKIDPATGISHADQRLYYQSKTLYTTDSNSELMDLDLNGMNNGSALHLDVQQHLSVSEERV
jgi:hypothetical protein